MVGWWTSRESKYEESFLLNWVAPTYRSGRFVLRNMYCRAGNKLLRRPEWPSLFLARRGAGNVAASFFSALSSPRTCREVFSAVQRRAGGPEGKTNAGTKAVEAELEEKESRRRRTRLSGLFSLVHKFPRAMNWATRILRRKLASGK